MTKNFFDINNKLNPNFVTGFIDAEGCFHVSIVDNTSLKVGKSVRAMFQISLHKKDKVRHPFHFFLVPPQK
jgi:intein-encoded DNA endonuclease-like protein